MNLAKLTHAQQHAAISTQLQGDIFFEQLVQVTRIRTENDRLYGMRRRRVELPPAMAPCWVVPCCLVPNPTHPTESRFIACTAAPSDESASHCRLPTASAAGLMP